MKPGTFFICTTYKLDETISGGFRVVKEFQAEMSWYVKCFEFLFRLLILITNFHLCSQQGCGMWLYPSKACPLGLTDEVLL
jgi:hypothetical protein